jgi:hypothetical protein
MKRQWGFSYIMTKKSTKRASADVGFMMTAYNLRRLINILGAERLREYLEYLIDLFYRKIALLERILTYMPVLIWNKEYWVPNSKLPADRLSLIHMAKTCRSF